MEELHLHALSLTFKEENGKLHAQFIPASGMLAPDHAAVKDALTNTGWGDFALDANAIDAFIARCRTTALPIEMVIGARCDGEFSLMLDDDLMTAWLTLIPPQGGQAVTRSALDDALREQGIVHGILGSEIDAAFAAGYCERLAIARGTPVQEGEPTRFTTLFDQSRHPFEEYEHARIKYTDFSHLTLVQPGDRLMRRFPAIPGKEGSNIKGQALLPKPVSDIPFRHDLPGAAPDQRDPDLLIATSGGQPVVKENGVSVNPVIEVLNVDFSTGSIMFEGTLRVAGDVKSGLRIKVSGDVIVNGTVEAAEIIADGNVAVRGGIVGLLDARTGAQSLSETTARIFCDGSVQALFTESAHIDAGKSILISRSACQCELIAGEEIVVGHSGGEIGQIIGGRTQARFRVAAGILGTPSGTKTQVQVGFNPYPDPQFAEKELELKRKRDEMDRVMKLLAYFRQNPEKSEGDIVAKVERTRQQLIAHIDTLTAELENARNKAGAADQARVDVSATIYYGTEIRIARQSWQAPDDMAGATLRIKDGRIVAGR